jgi:hypothetical protein
VPFLAREAERSLRNLFAAFDDDGSGRITAAEVWGGREGGRGGSGGERREGGREGGREGRGGRERTHHRRRGDRCAPRAAVGAALTADAARRPARAAGSL